MGLVNRINDLYNNLTTKSKNEVVEINSVEAKSPRHIVENLEACVKFIMKEKCEIEKKNVQSEHFKSENEDLLEKIKLLESQKCLESQEDELEEMVMRLTEKEENFEIKMKEKDNSLINLRKDLNEKQKLRCLTVENEELVNRINDLYNNLTTKSK